MKNMYIDVNVLQTVPSANINRDDTGAPKTAVYGGTMRSRVSSQAWKRVIRQSFAELDNTEKLVGHRTKFVPKLLAEKLTAKDESMTTAEALKEAASAVKKAGFKVDAKTNTTNVLLFVSDAQLDRIADYIIDANGEYDKAELERVFNAENSLDLALFGRMAAEDPVLNVDASVQVAHALSTHAMVPEFDYFTAIDDDPSAAGAAMIDTSEYNSATLYRYANVNVNELAYNLGSVDDAIKGAELFIKEFVRTMPTGKQNAYANKTMPSYVMISVRTDTPVNLVSAFEEAVESKNGYMDASIAKLEREYEQDQRFLDKPLATIVLTTKTSALADQAETLNELIERVAETVKRGMSDENTAD